MKYDCVSEGIFISRPNRFTAKVIADGSIETAHVRNTGRLEELLVKGAPVFLQKHGDSRRKTGYSLIGVKKGSSLVNIDSQAPNKVFYEWLKEGGLFSGVRLIKPEYRYRNSRVDFYVETACDRALIEVKGVTLEENGIAMFPDAPTQRGLKHVLELCESLGEGYRAYIAFVIQMTGISYFTPNSKTHRAFADALSYAKSLGVRVLALDCRVGADSLEIKDYINIRL